MNILEQLEQPESVVSRYTRYSQLKGAMALAKWREQRVALQDLGLRKAQREEADAEAMRGALAAGAVPEQKARVTGADLRLSALTSGTVALPGGGSAERPGMGLTLKSGASEVGTPARFDRGRSLAALAQDAPHLVREADKSFRRDEAAEQEQAAKLREMLGKADAASLGAVKESLALTGQLLAPVKNAPGEIRPQVWAAVMEKAERSGWVKPGTLPRQYPGDAALGWQLQQAMTLEEAVKAAETERHHREGEAIQRERIQERKERGTKPPEPVKLTPAALDKLAAAFYESGDLPAMGGGKEGARIRAAILNRAAEMYPEARFTISKR